ncbi:MAG: YihY/virulence factor BrkB family protein [Azonexus sp.]|nr:YihY/virulence factor BrkB family protein [Azonexus sp.]
MPAKSRIRSPFRLLYRVGVGFYRNQGFLLAGAIAYYALLSLLPLLILSVVVLSHLIDPALLLETVQHYLEWLLPSRSSAILRDIERFLSHRKTVGLVLIGTLLFFSAQAFSVLEKAMAVIFAHRGKARPRHFLVSAILPYCLVLLLAAALMVLTLASVGLQTLADTGSHWLGDARWFTTLTRIALQIAGVVLVGFVLAGFYLIIPVGKTRPKHALIGGLCGAGLWEVLRHGLLWYLSSVAKIGLVYGSFTTAVVLLFYMELAAILLLIGAQVIAEVERG